MTKISLTPIIDVVFILLIFFMLATNFQDFNKTEIDLTKSTASATVTDKRVFIIEFDEVCLSVRLSVGPFVRRSVCLSVRLSVGPSVGSFIG